MTSPFENCSGYFRPDFENYSVCGNVSDFCGHVKDLYSIDLTLRWAIFYIPCAMCSVALLMNVYIFYILVPIYNKMDEKTKKRYVFLLSRAVSSTMSAISIVLLPVAILYTDYNFWSIAVFIIFDILSFLSFLGGVVGTTITNYVAVVHPVYYRHELSYRKCLLLVGVLWISATVVAVGCGTVQAAFLGKSSPFFCDYDTCEKPTVFFAITCISITFVFTLAIQSFVIYSLIRHEKRSKHRGDFSNTTKLLEGVKRRLISAFVVILMMAVFEVTSASMLVKNVFSLTEENTLCYQFSSSGSRLRFVIFSAVLTLLWVVSLFLDPVFTILFDPIFKKEIRNQKTAAAIQVLKWLNFYAATSIFALSCLVNTYTLVTGLYTYYRLETESRKHYVFVLSRSLSSILAVVSLVVLEAFYFSSGFPASFSFYAVSFVLYNFSLNSLLISFIFVSLFTYIGVVHPMFYRKKMSLRVLYWTLSLTYLFSLVTSIPIGLYQAASNVPGGPITCGFHCSRTVNWITFGFSCFTLSATVLLNGFVLISLYWHFYKTTKSGIESSDATDRARIRLTWTFIILVLICFVELFPVGLVIGFDRNGMSSCKSFYQANEILLQAIATSTETFVGSVVFLSDPIITIFFDKNISQTVRRQLTWLRGRVCS